MATGESLRSLAFQFRISHSWISGIIREVLTSICKRMLKDFIPPPTKDHLTLVAEDYFKIWGFPNCCGAIDGKHVRIKCPKNSGSSFFNYKEYFSTVLLAITDAHYRFIAIDVGSYGREGDAGIYAKSNVGKLIADDKFPFPAPSAIPGTSITLGHVLIGDAAFSLAETMMKPYPQNQSCSDIKKATYNYRLSRARRTSENAFGILVQYFRIFSTPIFLAPEVIDKLITAACILHNMMRNSKIPFPGEQIFNKTRAKLPKKNFKRLTPTKHRSTNYSSKKVREILQMYFNSKKGALPWQKEYVKRLQ